MDDSATPEHPPPVPPPVKIGLARTLVRLALIAGLAAVLHRVFVWAEGWIMQSEYGWAMPGLLVAVLLIYALLIAIPFVPGVEIGLSVLAAGGPEIAPLVWLATATGLTLAYMVGCTVPIAWLRRILTDLHMLRAAHVLARFE